MFRALFVSLALLCSACAGSMPVPSLTPDTRAVVTAPTAPPAADLSGLAGFTVADLQAAAADADAQVPPDVTASQCYKFLAKVVPTIGPSGQAGTVGAFLIFQKTRDAINGLKGGASAGTVNLNLACAPLITDVNFTIAKLALIGGGIAATGGALAPFAGGLGAIGGALPIPIP